MTEPDRFAIIPIYSDSTGNGAIPQNAVAHGSWSAITGRIRDTKQQRQMLSLINDAAHARETLKDIRTREDSLKEAEASFQADVDLFNREIVQDFVNKLDALAARIDAMEAERAHDPDDDELPTPPRGPAMAMLPDDGELQSPAPRSPVAVEED